VARTAAGGIIERMIEMDLKVKIQQCKTMPELDELRLEIVRDEDNFLENQAAFIKQQNKLRRIPLSERNW
jgi:hypothetical protein